MKYSKVFEMQIGLQINANTNIAWLRSYPRQRRITVSSFHRGKVRGVHRPVGDASHLLPLYSPNRPGRKQRMSQREWSAGVDSWQ